MSRIKLSVTLDPELLGAVDVESDSDQPTAYALAQQTQLAPLNQ